MSRVVSQFRVWAIAWPAGAVSWGMGDSRLEPLVLTGDERRTLEGWVKRRSTAQGLALRARIVLACAQGGSNLAVAARLGVNRKTVNKWRARFLRERLDGLTDEPRPGVPRTITDAQVEEVVVRTLEEVPGGAAHWSKRSWPRGRVSRPPVCCGSGGRSGSSPGGPRRSSSPRTRC
jgi:transposase-like protein